MAEMESKEGRAALASRLKEVEMRQQNQNSAARNSLAKRRERPDVVPKDVDTSQYRISNLGTKHVKAIRYLDFATKLAKANPDKTMNRKIVEACFWKAVDNQMLQMRAKGPTAKVIVDEAKDVLSQADLYWEKEATQDERGMKGM